MFDAARVMTHRRCTAAGTWPRLTIGKKLLPVGAADREQEPSGACLARSSSRCREDQLDGGSRDANPAVRSLRCAKGWAIDSGRLGVAEE
jgi:hypothetical protein